MVKPSLQIFSLSRKGMQKPKVVPCRVKTSPDLGLIPLLRQYYSCCTTASESGQSRSKFPRVIMFKSSLLPCMLQRYLYWFNDPLNRYCTPGSVTLLRNNYSFSSIQWCQPWCRAGLEQGLGAYKGMEKDFQQH